MKLIDILKESEFEIPNIPNTMNFWHGGNLDNMKTDFKFNKNRIMFGIGLYLAKKYEVAKKYSKGNRKLYLVTVENGNDINDSIFNTDSCVEFVKKYCITSKRKELIHYVNYYSKENKISGYVFNNLLLNHNGVKPSNTQNLLNFYINNNVDYELNDNATYGKIMVLFNLQKIVKITKVTPKDKITTFDL